MKRSLSLTVLVLASVLISTQIFADVYNCEKVEDEGAYKIQIDTNSSFLSWMDDGSNVSNLSLTSITSQKVYSYSGQYSPIPEYINVIIFNETTLQGSVSWNNGNGAYMSYNLSCRLEN